MAGRLGRGARNGRIAQVTRAGSFAARAAAMSIFLNTGPAVARDAAAAGSARSPRSKTGQQTLAVTDLVISEGEAVGAVALDIARGRAGDDRRQGHHHRDRAG